MTLLKLPSTSSRRSNSTELVSILPKDCRLSFSHIVAAHLYFCYCSPPRLILSRDPSTRHDTIHNIETTFKTWYDTCQSLRFSDGNHHLSLTLKVCYLCVIPFFSC